MADKSPAPFEFKTPPVVEVALGVQFTPLAQFRAAHLGVLWSRFRKDFPRLQDQPALPRVVESFEKPVPPAPALVLEEASFVPRSWFIDSEGTHLIQVQQDRFVHNWRKTAKGGDYPSYGRLRSAFERHLRTFEAFLAEERLGDFKPDQCELTYVDHIESGEGWSHFGEMHRVLRVWKECKRSGFDLSPETVKIEIAYVFQDENRSPAGRLHVAAVPAYRASDKKPIFILQTVGRGRPLGPGVEGTLRFLDLAHTWAVRSFVALTTDEMHRQWGGGNA